MSEFRLGRYRGQWCAVRGAGVKRRRTQLGQDRAAAEEAIRKLNNPQPKRVTVRWLWAEYTREAEGKAVLETMKYTAKALLPVFGDMTAEDVSHEDVMGYISERRRAGKADGTIHTELGHLRTVILCASKRRRILHAPHIPRPPKPQPRDRYLTRSEARRLIDAAHFPHIRLLIILQLGTAARIRGILDLTWDRVDWERGLIHLTDPGDTTRRKRRAVVPMNGMVRAALAEAREGAIGPHVIEWGGRAVGSVKKALRTTVERAGLENVTSHVLRKTAGRWMAEAGVPMEEISQFLGHSSVRITREAYARFSPGYLAKAASVLDLGGPVETKRRDAK